MMCQNCGKNEAVFHYQSNINGAVTEQHLCSACAQNMEGSMFASVAQNPMRMLQTGFLQGGMLPGMMGYATRPGSLFQNMGGNFFAMPGYVGYIQGMPPQEAVETPAEPSEKRIPQDAGEEVRKRREISQLRSEMKRAVQEEDFERAAQLRDQIHRMETA